MKLNKLKKNLYKEAGKEDYRIFKSLYIKTEKKLNIFNLIKDRLILLNRVLLIPFFLKFEKKRRDNEYIIETQESFNIRLKYIQLYTKNNNIGFIDKSFKSKIIISSKKDLLIFIKTYFSSLFKTLYICFIPYNISFKFLSNYFKMQIKINILKPKKIYVSYSYEPQIYLLILYLSNRLKIEVEHNIANVLYEVCRYGFFPNITLSFISQLFLEEYISYKKIGWIKDYKTKYIITGREFFCNEQKEKIIYDIAFYSSGCWARDEKLFTIIDINKLKNMKRYYNKYAIRELLILKYLLKLSKDKNLKLIINMHPSEKKLIQKHNIYPPYWDCVSSYNIPINKQNTYSNIDNALIGVTLISGIFYDRWNENLYTLCYQFKRHRKYYYQIPLKYLGKYKKYGFKNLKELEHKILNYLKGLSV